MRILTLSYEYPPIGGGGSVVASSLNEMLVHLGDEVEVVTSRMRGLADEELIEGVRIHRARCVRRYPHYTTTAELATTLLPAYWRAMRVAREFNPQLIHAHFAVPSGIVARAISKRFHLPYVLTAHGSDIPGYNPDRFQLAHRFLPAVWRRVLSDASVVTSPSHFLAGMIRDRIDLPVEIIPNGYSPAPRQGRAKRKLVLAVARLFPRKGIQHLIDALCGLDTDWEFIVAGDGPYMDTLRRQATQARVPIRFAGFLDRTALRALYEEASIMVFPSIRENFPMVLLEAMDAGCAIVSTDADGCAEVVADTAVTVRCADPVQIRAALERLMHDPRERESLARAARHRVRQFRWPVVADRYRRLFADVLGIEATLPPGVRDLAETGLFTLPKLPP
jgi:glycosyltransferase involved in cell wall biosynthesis